MRNTFLDLGIATFLALNIGLGTQAAMTDRALSAAWSFGVSGFLLAIIIILAGR